MHSRHVIISWFIIVKSNYAYGSSCTSARECDRDPEAPPGNAVSSRFQRRVTCSLRIGERSLPRCCSPVTPIVIHVLPVEQGPYSGQQRLLLLAGILAAEALPVGRILGPKCLIQTNRGNNGRHTHQDEAQRANHGRRRHGSCMCRCCSVCCNARRFVTLDPRIF